MALSGLDIYKLLAKTNCKECGSPTCLAFAMQLAGKKTSLDKCPYVSDEAKAKLEGAAAPPIKLVTIGDGEKKLEVGNETVLFRHDEKFHHPAGVAVLVEDNLPGDKLDGRLKSINALSFDRVGQKISVNLVAVKDTGSDGAFVEAVKKVSAAVKFPLILMSTDAAKMKQALELCAKSKPLIHSATKENLGEFTALAKQYSCPLCICDPDLEQLSALAHQAAAAGVESIILDTGQKPLSRKINDLTQIRRLALKKTFRPLGYPVLVVTQDGDPYQETAGAASCMAKYAGIVVIRNMEPWQVLPLLTLRQDIYTDPQKPSQVEPKLYEVGQVTDKSPLLVTTNFSITYYTVESEVEGSRVPSYILSCDAEGLSVLTAWAADKFNAKTIAEALAKTGAKEKVSHNKVVLPGYVAVLSGKLEEESGWKVVVGPREASGIPSFLKSLKL